MKSAGFCELSEVTAHKIVPVVVIDVAQYADSLGEALIRGGLPVAEVTFRTSAASDAIRALANRQDILVGAGTILTPEQVEQAAAAGARFIVSPGLDRDVIERCQQIGIPCLPGVSTATELMQALKFGFTTVKFFPASAAGGAKTIKALSSAFQQARFLPTGGISAENAHEYLDLDCVRAIGGSWMVPSQLVNSGAVDQLVDLITHAVSTVGNYRKERS